MPKTKKDKVYLILILIIIAATVVMIAVMGGKQPVKQEVEVPTLPERPDTQVVYRDVEKFVEIEKTITGTIIEDGLRDMGILITQEYYFTEVINFSSVKKFFKTDISLKFTESSYLASYDGVVTAGIDFDEIRVEKDEDTKIVTITMPRSTIRNVDIDPESFVLYSEKEGLGNPISIADFNTSLIELENSASEKALKNGILDRADENARNIVRNFILGLVDGTEYKIVFAG